MCTNTSSVCGDAAIVSPETIRTLSTLVSQLAPVPIVPLTKASHYSREALHWNATTLRSILELTPDTSEATLAWFDHMASTLRTLTNELADEPVGKIGPHDYIHIAALNLYWEMASTVEMAVDEMEVEGLGFNVAA